MNREQKIQQTFRLVEAIVGGYSSQENKIPVGLIEGAWAKLFKNCYSGVNAMLNKAEEIDPSEKIEPNIK